MAQWKCLLRKEWLGVVKATLTDSISDEDLELFEASDWKDDAIEYYESSDKSEASAISYSETLMDNGRYVVY